MMQLARAHAQLSVVMYEHFPSAVADPLLGQRRRLRLVTLHPYTGCSLLNEIK